MFLLLLGGFLALYGATLWLLHHRLLPVLLMRVWFTGQLAITVIGTHVGCRLISFVAYTLHLLRPSTAQALSRFCKHVAFKEWFAMNVPHVRVTRMPGSLPYSALKEGAICSSHCSFFDSLFFLFLIPYSLLWNGRTFLKSSLRNMPLFGYALRCAAYFPVYFADESSASFSVNKDKQLAVAAEVEEWVSQGKSLCFYPEGVMNRTPEVLKDFRLGSFNTVLKHKMPLHYLVVYGNHEVWSPSFKGLPGFPADIYTYVGKYEYNPETADARSLAAGLREEMQRHLDDMIVMRKTLGYEPCRSTPHKD